ncbi:MAG: hypothetical protein NT175_02495 [Bacteroidetes bacterium]|nr:hypothetical protein [Bacteroidota bacterium]
MKLMLLLLLFPGSFNSNYEDDTISNRQIILIQNFLNDINNDSISIATYHKYIDRESLFEGYNLDVQCFKRNLSKDSCLLFQKNYCENPQNISYTLIRLRDLYFTHRKINHIAIEKLGSCSVYKVFIESNEQDKKQAGNKENYEIFYFVIFKMGREPDYIIDILDDCLNSIMIG